jgi:methyl-accepting chemotaxis protein
MKASIQTKLVFMCIFLVLLTAISISATYYVLTRRDKHRESQQRIQIAFDIILDDFRNRLNTYKERFDSALEQESALRQMIYLYTQEGSQEGAMSGASFLKRIPEGLKRLGPIVSANRLLLYGEDKQLLALYQWHDNQETVGVYTVSQTGKNTYLPADDAALLNSMLLGEQPIPDNPLPSGIIVSYEADIPDTIAAEPFSDEQRFGIRITTPVQYMGAKIGVLIGEILYASSIVEGYALLSKTDVNFFAGNQLSVGTLPAQTKLESEALEQFVMCEALLTGNETIDVFPVSFDNQKYYQGQCVFRNAQGTVGAITVSLSQAIEKQAIRKILTSVLVISGIVIGLASGLSLIFSRKTIHAIHNIVNVIIAAAEGNLRKTASVTSQDEVGMLALKLNQMITQLRTISGQVQDAAYAVNGTADTILQQMEALIQHMEQQSSSVDNTVVSIEEIKQFIDAVARNTDALLSASSQILASIQETRATINEVTKSTDALTTNLHLISSSVDQVNQSVKQISENTGQLAELAQQTETEVRHIDHSLRDVSHNADQAQQLARETMDAATSGQVSVDASIQGMAEVKEVVSDTAQIIQEVNTWGGQVSSILDIVDEITEQTSLLALNASIISAQAGVHGRGFAVVAEEIKELATRTKTSTKEIGTLIHELQGKTADGVKKTAEGIAKADQGVRLANAVKDALTTILDSATRSSSRAADTAQVIQQTTASSQIIRTSMSKVTEMVSSIGTAIQEQEGDIEKVVAAVENISGMSEQVNRASVEQKRAAEEIERSMEDVTGQFSGMSEQTEALRQNSDQIVAAMHMLESTTGQILQDTTKISGETVKNLVQQSDVLQKIVNVFKVS